MKPLLFISQDREMALIQELIYKIKMAKPDWHPSRTCFLCVSPDYSSIVTQHLSHALTVDGEIYNIESVNVPFPDESVTQYKVDFEINLQYWMQKWENFVLIEAGIIRGGNYTWITDTMRANHCEWFETVALCENVRSKFASDYVGMYYDNDIEDLHFWWEQPNNHWQPQ